MKILIVSQYFWPEDFRINELAVSLVKRGHKVTVLTGKPNYPQGRFFKGYGFFGRSREDYNGVEILRVPIFPRGKTRLGLVLNYLSFAINAGVFGPFICKLRFDVILVFQLSPVTIGIPAVVFKKLKQVPILFWVQDLWPESISAVGGTKNNGIIIKVVKKLVRYLYSHSDKILIQSRAFTSSILEVNENVRGKICYFPNFAEDIYQPVKNDTRSSLPEGISKGFKIMFAGNIGYAQGFDTIIQAAKITSYNKDIRWIIVGDGSQRSWAEKRIKELGLEGVFHFLGRYPVQRMPTFFSAADVLLVSLKKEPIFALTIPSKIQSYMACAKPIIACLDGEGQHIVKEARAGVSCDADDPEGLAKQVLKIYSMSSNDLLEMGVNGRNYYEKNFEKSMLIERLETWINEVSK